MRNMRKDALWTKDFCRITAATALGAAGGITLLFAVLFALRPRELIYFIALWLGVFLVYSLLLINLVV